MNFRRAAQEAFSFDTFDLNGWNTTALGEDTETAQREKLKAEQRRERLRKEAEAEAELRRFYQERQARMKAEREARARDKAEREAREQQQQRYTAPRYSPTPYEILGITYRATPAEIRAAWVRLMKQNHPDVGGDADMAKAVNAAYTVLKSRT